VFRRKWSPAEILAVLSRYPPEGPAALALELRRSEDSVSSQARRFGLRTPRRPYQRSRQVHTGRSIKDAPSEGGNDPEKE
jgi:hypothetical protein